MGCFDTVKIICPNCRTVNDIQTKAGECGLDEFYIENAPPIIKADMADSPMRCDFCEKGFIVRTQAISTVYKHDLEED